MDSALLIIGFLLLLLAPCFVAQRVDLTKRTLTTISPTLIE